MSPNNSSTTGERSPSSCRRRCPRVRKATTRWRVRSTTWGISSLRPVSTSWTRSPWTVKVNQEDWPTSSWRASGNGGRSSPYVDAQISHVISSPLVLTIVLVSRFMQLCRIISKVFVFIPLIISFFFRQLEKNFINLESKETSKQRLSKSSGTLHCSESR